MYSLTLHYEREGGEREREGERGERDLKGDAYTCIHL